MLESDWLEGAKSVRKIATAASVRARMDNKHWNKTPKSSKRGLGFDFLFQLRNTVQYVFWFDSFGLVFCFLFSTVTSFLMGCVSQTAKAVAVLKHERAALLLTTSTWHVACWLCSSLELVDLADKDSVHARFENIPRQGGDLFLKVDDDDAVRQQ
jgi:hypothetical protein